MKKFMPIMVTNIGRAIIIEKKNKILFFFFLKKWREKDRGGKNKKRQRGGILGKKRTQKVMNEFAKAKNYLSKMTKKGWCGLQKTETSGWNYIPNAGKIRI